MQNQVSAPINVQFTMALLAVVVDRAFKSVNTFRVFSNVGMIQGTSKYKLVPSDVISEGTIVLVL